MSLEALRSEPFPISQGLVDSRLKSVSSPYASPQSGVQVSAPGNPSGKLSRNIQGSMLGAYLMLLKRVPAYVLHDSRNDGSRYWYNGKLGPSCGQLVASEASL